MAGSNRDNEDAYIQQPSRFASTKKIIETPKPDSILAEEKRLGVTFNPIYEQADPGDPSTSYGPPIQYKYTNDQNQDVGYSPSGQYIGTFDRPDTSNNVLKLLATMGGAMFLAPAVNSFFGGAAAGGAAAGGAGLLGAEGTIGALEAGQLAALNTGGGLTTSGAGALGMGGGTGLGAGAGLGGGAGLTAATLGTDAALGAGATLGGGATLGTGTTLGTLGTGAPLMGGGTGLTALAGTGLAAGSALASGNAGIPSMGGGTGLTALSNVGAPAEAPLTAPINVIPGMGGGTGLTAPAAGGGTVSAGGVTPAGGTNVSAGGVTPVTGTPSSIDPSALANNPSLIKQLQDATGLNGTQLAALLSGGVNAASAANISGAIGEGLKGQREATKASQDVLKGVYNQQLGFQQPYQGAGVNAINQLGQLGSGQYQQYDPVTGQPTTTGAGSGYLTHQFNAADLAGGLAPNYDFMLQQGQMANQRAANVGGGALSGNTLQGLNKYTQDYAGTAYQNAFQNYQTQRNNIYNNLSNMAGIGQTANQGAGTAGTSYGTGITGLNTGLANATAAALLGQAQAAGGGANSLANSTFLAALLGQK